MRLVPLVFAALLLAAPVAQAQEAAKPVSPIAVLNLKALMKESKAAASIRQQIEAKRSQFQKEIGGKEESLRKRDKELSEKRNLLAKDAFEQERKKFEQEVISVQREVQMKRLQLDRAYAKSLEKIREEVVVIIRDDIGQQRPFEVVLPASEVLFFQPTVDITAPVLAKLDQRLPSVNVVIEEIDLEKLQKEAAEAAE
jgi:outer membrane protein